ncbi:hypothetical protein [Tumebacillus flagellatus]|uniref:WxL domain-containing protein n=1 Tax=Tumebacillus flagellatus TaxID=1157490 RepID=A0A074LTT0_9BACL|nr:hypothetical protein [Tumebacillus flagellatus]KEO84040.1 hypothetical protein EL26_06135 [Tumebacillus flagellatus]
MKKALTFLGTMVLTLAIGVTIGQVSKADTPSAPGSADDPIVTKSYVDQKVAGVSGGGSTGNTGSTGGTSAPADMSFKVVTLNAGQTIKGGEGTELILRGGTATAIASSNGGVSDVTGGTDLAQGANVELNHLLLTPRNDGRGMKVGNGTAYLMVRGAYTVQ